MKTSGREWIMKFKLKYWSGSKTNSFNKETQRKLSTNMFKGKKPLYYQKRWKCVEFPGTNLKSTIYYQEEQPNRLK